MLIRQVRIRMSKLIVAVVCTVAIFQNVFAEKEVDSPSRKKRSKADDSISACANDYVTTSVCVACADLPPGLGLPLDACCESKFVQMVCAACLMDLDSCTKETGQLKSDDLDPEMVDNEHDEMNFSKRYGRLFMDNNSPLPTSYRSSNEKRFGRLFLSSNPNYQLTRPEEKRFGTLFMGSRPGIGYGRNYELDRNKRYGTLFMNKRFGRLFLGTGYGRISDDKRSTDEDDLPIDLSSESRDKRFGRLFLSSSRLAGNPDKKSD